MNTDIFNKALIIRFTKPLVRKMYNTPKGFVTVFNYETCRKIFNCPIKIGDCKNFNCTKFKVYNDLKKF